MLRSTKISVLTCKKRFGGEFIAPNGEKSVLIFSFSKILILALFFSSSFAVAQNMSPRESRKESIGKAVEPPSLEFKKRFFSPKSVMKKTRKKAGFKRGTAALLCLLLGVFGVHRLYLGTSEKVPLFYTLTLGGLLLLPVVDFFIILFRKDKEQMLNNSDFILW